MGAERNIFSVSLTVDEREGTFDYLKENFTKLLPDKGNFSDSYI